VRNFLAAMAVCSVVSVALPTVASPDGGRQATVFRVKQPSAGALAFFGDCADPINQPVGAVCHETFIILFRETHVVDGGSNAPSQAPWAFYATSYTLTFVAPLTDPVISDQVEGFVLDPALASSDREHLSTASVAAQVRMSDGSTFDFQGTWTASSDRVVYGNDGPDAGAIRHFVDKCSTDNANAHQKYRLATMSGTLNGQPVHTYTTIPDAGVIFYNHFVYIDTTHGACS
jgi:hypothetical protein